MLFDQLVCTSVHYLVLTSGQLTPELLVAIMGIVVRLLATIRVNLVALFAVESDIGKLQRDLIGELLGSEGLIAVGAGAFTICPRPVSHTRGAEHALTIRALLGLANNFSAHLTNELVINLSNCLIFSQLMQYFIWQFYPLISGF